jgi:tripartite-type tricarboxylate transporter receptor subunit TctC
MFRPVFAAAFAMVLALPAEAQTSPTQIWPTRPVTMVVPFAAGGPMDVVGRIMAASLSEQLGQQVIVENVGGGGGMTGAARVAKAPPDGSQFVLGNVGTHAVSQSLSKNPPYNVAADFAPVALFADLSLVLVTRRDLPAANLQEFIAYTRANQDKMQFASASAGSATHLGCALLNAAIGVNVTHIPYRGGGPAMQDIVAGRVDYICIDTPGVISLIESGQIKAMAVLSGSRTASLPNVPTAQEQGLAGFEAANWAAFFMAKGTPAPIVERLAAASAAATGSDAVQKRMKENGVDPVAPERRSPEYLAKFVDGEIAKWAGPVKASGLATD